MRSILSLDPLRLLYLTLVLIMIVFLSSCASLLCRSDSPVSAKKGYFPDTEISSSQISREIQEKEDLLKTTSDPKARSRTCLRLASLHSSHKNPSPDYSRAYTLLSEHVALEPEKGKSEIIQYWLSLLKAYHELQQKNSLLQKENSETKAVIEKLKHIDIHIEERRKQVK